MSDAMAEAEWTCGRGLAANAAVPEAVGELLRATADLLDAHRRAVPEDSAEDAVYESLSRQHREAADMLAGIAAEMAGSEGLAVVEHDMDVMNDGVQQEAFERYVGVQRRLLGMMRQTVREADEPS